FHIEELKPDEIKKKIMIVNDCEARGDEIERKIIDELDATFITPIDREDIHTLAINIDRATDILNSISRKIEFYQIRSFPLKAYKFSELIVAMGNLLKSLMHELERKKNVDSIQREMHTKENEADDLFHQSMAELFTLNHDPIDIIRFKEVYEHMESIIDSVDYIGKLVRGIMVKQG
ncbi:MAG: DUF47 family protein, partial [Candidatus Aureabacteria bacterium]|nr:DUF47 family protein [Candidatus Auribacterota bacterium]